MADYVYKQIELTGTSNTSIEEAVQNAITRASKTVHNMQWFEILETRGSIEKGKIGYWQVIMKIGFKLED
jgi:flavin-binding protein dodecin